MSKLCHRVMYFPQEHIINHWEDGTPAFHNRLVVLYQKEVQKHLVEYKTSIRGQRSYRSCDFPTDVT